jgi:hypothetical protein
LHAASTLYDTLGIEPEKLSARKAPFSLGNRNVQLLLAYSILWEAFDHIYTAAAYTDFARNGPERAPIEDERAKIARPEPAPDHLGRSGGPSAPRPPQ